MGLLTILKKLKQKEHDIRIMLLGLDNAGKTTLMKRLSGEDTSQISPTMGFNIQTLAHRDYQLNFWDVGGQKSLRPFWRNYFERTDAVIWVVDSADRLRMCDCANELQQLLVEERLLGATLLVFANKQDLPGALDFKQIRDALNLDSLTTHHWQIVACSAAVASDQRILEGIDWLIDDVSARIFDLY